MFSSGSECSPRGEREYARGLSALTSTIGDVFESSGGAAVPVLSPVLGQMVSSSSGLGDGMLMLDGEEPESAAASPTAKRQGEASAEPSKRFPETEAWQSRARTANGGPGVGAGADVGGGGVSGPPVRGAVENAEGGAHTSASAASKDGHHWQRQSGGLPLPAGIEAPGVPNGGAEPSQDGSGSGNGSSSSPSARRRGRPLSEEPNAAEVSKGGGVVKSNKRRHVPTPKHRLPTAWGTLPTGGHQEEADQEDGGDRGDTPSSSDFNSGSNKTSDSGAAIAAVKKAAAAAAPPAPPPSAEILLAPPPAPAPPAPQAPIDFSNNNGVTASDLLSEFDSNTTWAGASAISVATTRTAGTGWGSVLDTSSALSQYPSSHLSTTAAKLDAAAVWSQQPLVGKSGDLNGVVSVTTTANRRSRGRASPPHNLRVPGGTPARRGVRKPKPDKMSAAAGGDDDSSKPRALARPTSTSRRAAMSPHGVAMDAAIRIVEERGARLGIVREEKEDAAAAAVAAANNSDQANKDAAYANQIASPAMTSLEQRRQRAKAWAKSRYVPLSRFFLFLLAC